MNRINILIPIIIVLLAVSLKSYTQCNPNASKWESTWESCAVKANPNSSLSASHWIIYDLGASYYITDLTVYNDNWNPSRGFKETEIHFSEDKVNWTPVWSDLIPRANGAEDYSGFDINLNSERARYVLLTAINNHGDPACAGISEVKITAFENEQVSTGLADVSVDDVSIEFYPNPTSGYFTIKGDFQNYTIQILDVNGQVHQDLSNQSNLVSINLSSLPEGMYFIRLINQQNDLLWIEQMIKME